MFALLGQLIAISNKFEGLQRVIFVLTYVVREGLLISVRSRGKIIKLLINLMALKM